MESTQEKFKLRLGIFVTGGFILFVLAVFIIGKQKNLFDAVFSISSTFNNVSGLQVGNNVRMFGINVGTVDNIQIINDSTVEVHMLIEKHNQKYVKTDALVSIGSEGIIGDRLLVISQGGIQAKMIKNGGTLASNEPTEMDAIMKSLEVTALNVEFITDDLSDIFNNINQGKGTLGRLISDSSIADDLSKTMQHMHSSSRGLDQNMEALKENIILRRYYRKKEAAKIKK